MALEDITLPSSPFEPQDLAKMLMGSEVENIAASEMLIEEYLKQYKECLKCLEDEEDWKTFIIAELAYLRCMADTLMAGFHMMGEKE